MASKSYKPFSLFWGLLIPGVVMGLIYWGYTQPGYVGSRFTRWFGPVIEPAMKLIDRIF